MVPPHQDHYQHSLWQNVAAGFSLRLHRLESLRLHRLESLRLHRLESLCHQGFFK
jgi:hypothetical protein